MAGTTSSKDELLVSQIAALKAERDLIPGLPPADRFSRFAMLAKKILRLEEELLNLSETKH
jgi:hypothetical protein